MKHDELAAAQLAEPERITKRLPCGCLAWGDKRVLTAQCQVHEPDGDE